MTGCLIHFFTQGLFKDFPGPTLQNVCVESYVLGINTCTCRNARQKDLETTCKPDLHCALVAQWTCAKATREQWEQRNKCFHTFCKHFENFIFCIPEHLFSLTLKLISVDIFDFVKAIPIKCFVSHRPPYREGGSVGRAKKKKKGNDHLKGSGCQGRPGC